MYVSGETLDALECVLILPPPPAHLSLPQTAFKRGRNVGGFFFFLRSLK